MLYPYSQIYNNTTKNKCEFPLLGLSNIKNKYIYQSRVLKRAYYQRIERRDATELNLGTNSPRLFPQRKN